MAAKELILVPKERYQDLMSHYNHDQDNHSNDSVHTHNENSSVKQGGNDELRHTGHVNKPEHSVSGGVEPTDAGDQVRVPPGENKGRLLVPPTGMRDQHFAPSTGLGLDGSGDASGIGGDHVVKHESSPGGIHSGKRKGHGHRKMTEYHENVLAKIMSEKPPPGILKSSNTKFSHNDTDVKTVKKAEMSDTLKMSSPVENGEGVRKPKTSNGIKTFRNTIANTHKPSEGHISDNRRKQSDLFKNWITM